MWDVVAQHITARMDPEDVAWLDEQAKANRTTRSWMLGLAVRRLRGAPAGPAAAPASSRGSASSAPSAKTSPPRRAYPRDPDDCTHPINYRDNSNRCNACGDQR